MYIYFDFFRVFIIFLVTDDFLRCHFLSKKCRWRLSMRKCEYFYYTTRINWIYLCNFHENISVRGILVTDSPILISSRCAYNAMTKGLETSSFWEYTFTFVSATYIFCFLYKTEKNPSEIQAILLVKSEYTIYDSILVSN